MFNEYETEVFKIESYRYGELAQKYFPDLKPKSATNKLTYYIQTDDELFNKLKEYSYRKKQRFLFPIHVKIIVEFLGPPL